MTCESDIHPSMQLTHIYWQRVWPCAKHVFFWCFDVRGHVIIEGLPLLEWPILDETTHLLPVCAPFIVRLINCIPHSTNLLYWAFPLWATIPNPWCARAMPDSYRQTPHHRAHWNVQPSPPRTCLPPSPAPSHGTHGKGFAHSCPLFYLMTEPGASLCKLPPHPRYSAPPTLGTITSYVSMAVISWSVALTVPKVKTFQWV